MTTPAVVPTTCPDCGRVASHDATCPIAVDIDRTSAADRGFSEDHPGATVYHRAVTPSEVHTLRSAGLIPDVPGQVRGRVRVTNVGPGMRTRNYGDVWYLLDTAGVQ